MGSHSRTFYIFLLSFYSFSPYFFPEFFCHNLNKNLFALCSDSAVNLLFSVHLHYSAWVFSAKAQMSREFLLFGNLVCFLFYCFSTHLFFIFCFIIIYFFFFPHKTSVPRVALIFRSLDDYLEAVKWRPT